MPVTMPSTACVITRGRLPCQDRQYLLSLHGHSSGQYSPEQLPKCQNAISIARCVTAAACSSATSSSLCLHRRRTSVISAASRTDDTPSASVSAPKKQFNVLITGSTKGVGRALAQEFLGAGDNVCISSRSADRVQETVADLGAAAAAGGGSLRGTAADVSKPADVAKLAQFVTSSFGSVDIWINNAGSNGYKYTALRDSDVNDLVDIVSTNTLGTMLSCREAIQLMSKQPRGGHIFNMDGAGADGNPTPKFAAYGSTKRGLAQFTKSLGMEIKQQKLKNVVVHNLSPGMVNTELLMSGSTSSKVAKFFINCLAEEPADVATFLVPRIREASQQNKTQYIRALTKPAAFARIFDRFITGNRKSRYLEE